MKPFFHANTAGMLHMLSKQYQARADTFVPDMMDHARGQCDALVEVAAELKALAEFVEAHD